MSDNVLFKVVVEAFSKVLSVVFIQLNTQKKNKSCFERIVTKVLFLIEII